MEHIICVDKILNTVQPIGLNHIDRVQNGDNWLKRTHAGVVIHILYNGDVGDGTGFLLSDLAVLHLKIPFGGVHAEVGLALLVYLFQNTSDLFLPYATVVDAKRRPRVKGVDRGGRAIFLPSLIGKYHTNRYTADVHPVGQLLVESVFTLRSHVLVERVHTGGNIIFSTVGHIADWAIQ